MIQDYHSKVKKKPGSKDPGPLKAVLVRSNIGNIAPSEVGGRRLPRRSLEDRADGELLPCLVHDEGMDRPRLAVPRLNHLDVGRTDLVGDIKLSDHCLYMLIGTLLGGPEHPIGIILLRLRDVGIKVGLGDIQGRHFNLHQSLLLL
jgi:hypothetical protein